MDAPLWPSWLPLREDLQSLSPYGAPQIDQVTRLNTNENPFPLSESLSKAITARVGEIATSLNRYPDRDALKLRDALAQFLNGLSNVDLTTEQIWAANGSNEILQSLFLAFGGGLALGFTPSYSMHSLIARVTGSRWEDGGRRPDFSLDPALAAAQILALKPSLTFLATPNNPTGTAICLEDLEILARAVGVVGGLLIVDEAYAEFNSGPSAITLLGKYPHLVVTRTMSKAFAFAGARVGYLAAAKSVVEAMQIVRLPYHLSSITQAIALVAIENSQEQLNQVATLIMGRQWLVKELDKLGIVAIASSANFLLFPVSSAHEIWQSLLDQGVLVRDVGMAGYLRVSIGNDIENQQFISALRSSLDSLD